MLIHTLAGLLNFDQYDFFKLKKKSGWTILFGKTLENLNDNEAKFERIIKILEIAIRVFQWLMLQWEYEMH